MNDFFTSGEKLTAFKLNELFRKLSTRLDSLESSQTQAARESGYNSGAVTAIPGTPRGLDNPRPAYPPTRHAITPQSFYTHFKTNLWQFPTVGEPNQGIGHEVTSGTDGYDTDGYGETDAEEAVSITYEASITGFYPVSWTDKEGDEQKATGFFGVEWEEGLGTHFLHLQGGGAYEFSNTYDPETGSITWSQQLGQPKALPWGQGGGHSGRWHYFQTNFDTILPTAISSYSKTDGEFASVHVAKNGASKTVPPSEDASYALYDKAFLNGAKFKRLRQGFGTEISEYEGIISIETSPWEVLYDIAEPYTSDTEDTEESGHKSITSFAWYGYHQPAHESHAVNNAFQVSPGSGTVWWHVYNSEADLASNTSATSRFGLSVMVDKAADGRARVAFQAEGGVVIPSGTTDTATSWTTAYAISNTADFGDYGIAAHGAGTAFFAHNGTGSVEWHVTNSHSSVTGSFGFNVDIERATDIYPDGARVRLTPFGGIQLPAGGSGGLPSVTAYINAVSMTAPDESPQLFDGHIVIPSDQNTTLSGRIAEWHLRGIGRIGLQLTATTWAGETGVSLTYAPYMIHNT